MKKVLQRGVHDVGYIYLKSVDVRPIANALFVFSTCCRIARNQRCRVSGTYLLFSDSVSDSVFRSIRTCSKTTTLGMLTGDIQPTSGAGFISGLPLSHPDTRHLIGFCPQTDPLLELMTGYETLWFFGRVRGLPSEELHKRCLELIGQVGLTAHASKPCGTYSGGNKRKLSLAVVSAGRLRVVCTCNLLKLYFVAGVDRKPPSSLSG